MTTDKLIQRARARQEYKLSRARHFDQLRDAGTLLRPPKPTIINVLDDSGLYPASELGAPISVKVPKWEPSPENPGNLPEFVDLSLYNSTDAVLFYVRTPVPVPIDSDVIVDIPVASIPNQGDYKVGYLTVGWDVNPGQGSDTAPLIIDRQPPYYNPGGEATPAAIKPPVAVITDAYLASAGGVVECEVPAYTARTLDDQITVYLDLGTGFNINLAPVFGPEPLPDTLKISIPGAAIAGRADGVHQLFYKLRDKAGNSSDISEPANLELQLGPVPAGLTDPVVTPIERPLVRDDVYEPVLVEIAQFTNADKGIIKAMWGGTLLDEVILHPGHAFPIKINVPWAVMFGEYDPVGSAEQTATISYQVWRGSQGFPEAGALTTEVTVDFAVVGPENPDPGPINDLLPLVHLTSSSGATDELKAEDIGQPATASVLLHANPVAGEIIDLYWRDKVVDTFTISGEVEDDPIEFDITWEQIEAGGNDVALPMTYTIVGPGGNNPQRAKSTSVKVEVVVIELEVPSFPTRYNDGPVLINCSSLDCDTQALRIWIPGNGRYLKAGDVITITSELFTNAGLPVANTRFTENYQLKSGEEHLGVERKIQPYDEFIQPVISGRIKASYSAVVSGTTVSSPTVEEIISLFSGGVTTCPVRPCP